MNVGIAHLRKSCVEQPVVGNSVVAIIFNFSKVVAFWFRKSGLTRKNMRIEATKVLCWFEAGSFTWVWCPGSASCRTNAFIPIFDLKIWSQLLYTEAANSISTGQPGAVMLLVCVHKFRTLDVGLESSMSIGRFWRGVSVNIGCWWLNSVKVGMSQQLAIRPWRNL